MNVTDMNALRIDPEALRSVFTAIGLSDREGREYYHRTHKHRQIFDFIPHLEKAAGQLSSKRTLRFVDCACGRSYLSFVANFYLTRLRGGNIEFTCIDHSRHVVDKSIEAAAELGFDNMRFICGDISRAALGCAPDVVYSLHACNTATDMTIARGMNERAKFILTVSCCQHSVRARLKGHPLTAVTTHSVYKERLADMLSDTMRGLLLEEAGYLVDLFEYVPARETPKNVMLRAVRSGYDEKRAARARDAYDRLRETFHTEPGLAGFLRE